MSYITKDEQKKYMGIDWTVGLDTFVDTVISGCEKYIERYCGDSKNGDRLFEAPTPDDDSVRRFNGSGQKRLFMGDLFAITSVTIDDVAYTNDEDFYAYPLNEETAFQYLELTQPVTRLNSNSRIGGMMSSIFEAGQANILIDGKWYFSATPPADVKMAMFKLVGAILKENIGDSDLKDIKTEKFDDYSITFQDVDKIAHALKVSDILNQYSRAASLKASGGSGSAGIRKAY